MYKQKTLICQCACLYAMSIFEAVLHKEPIRTYHLQVVVATLASFLPHLILESEPTSKPHLHCCTLRNSTCLLVHFFSSILHSVHSLELTEVCKVRSPSSLEASESATVWFCISNVLCSPIETHIFKHNANTFFPFPFPPVCWTLKAHYLQNLHQPQHQCHSMKAITAATDRNTFHRISLSIFC